MPKKSKTPETNLSNVKITITHIVPTTQYGNVSYKAECDATQAEDVGLFLANLIGSLYPPFNPITPFDVEKKLVQEVLEDNVDDFNQQANEVERQTTAETVDMNYPKTEDAF